MSFRDGRSGSPDPDSIRPCGDSGFRTRIALLNDAAIDSWPTLLFVYGTLMHGYDHPMAQMLAERADWRGRATCCGRLYRITHYPGLVLSDDPDDLVHGDVFVLPEDDGALLAALDEYEGCGANDPPPHPYRRVTTDLTLADGTFARAETYEYILPVREERRIVSGNFFKGD